MINKIDYYIMIFYNFCFVGICEYYDSLWTSRERESCQPYKKIFCCKTRL